MSIKKHIPNAITCCNLFSGCVACVMAFSGKFEYAMLFIVLGAVFVSAPVDSARVMFEYYQQIFFIIGLIFTWRVNVKQNKISEQILKSGRKLKSAKDDIASMIESRLKTLENIMNN